MSLWGDILNTDINSDLTASLTKRGYQFPCFWADPGIFFLQSTACGGIRVWASPYQQFKRAGGASIIVLAKGSLLNDE